MSSDVARLTPLQLAQYPWVSPPDGVIPNFDDAPKNDGSIFIGLIRGRMGYHGWDISIAQTMEKDFAIPLYLLTVLQPPIMLFLKATFFIMYLYIFSPMRWMRFCGYAGALFTTAFYGSTTIIFFVYATPSRGESWDNYLASDHSFFHLTNIYLSQASVGLAIDLAIFILPVIAVLQLQLPRR
ncbi:MAG: hypothetical protein Q9222_004009 [Ikaeria aurantiellina]